MMNSRVGGWVHSQIDKHHIDRELRESALRAVDRYLEEHKQFLMAVAVEALLQKLRDKGVSSTATVVPYTKPAPIPLDEYNRTHPERQNVDEVAVPAPASSAPVEARGVSMEQGGSREFRF